MRLQTVVLGKEFWDEDLVAALVGLGLTVKSMAEEEGTIIISRQAWRVPKDIQKKDLLDHIGTIIKQARALDAVPAAEDTTSVGAGSKPKKSAKGKRKPKDAAPPPDEPTEHEPGVRVEEPKRRKKSE